ncbi:LysM peptidoglycan-binding domain-containing protein [Candidatus Roizmanbacteria bacterium]|nr:MAG: LysM peptidoglycan-binding domain-containing protein [Candidatus Roizmanbacteria bacterium]
MEQDAHATQDYKKMTADIIRENTTAFAIGGFLFLIALAAVGIRYGEGIGKTLSQQGMRFSKLFATTETSNGNLDEIANSVRDQSINYISPVPKKSIEQSESLGIVAEENGQISAISSGQVTYQRNKYTIQRGESLQDIARKVYGDPNAWVRIAQANNITNPDHIEVGMELTIPR